MVCVCDRRRSGSDRGLVLLLSPLQLQTFSGSTAAEVRYAGAFAQAVSHDQLSIALIEGGIIIVFAAIAVVIADRFSFRRDDDPLSRLAIVGALLALVYLAAVPVRNAVQRSYDFADDDYAVAFTDDPAGAVRALIRDADQRMVEVCPAVERNALPLHGARHRRPGHRDQSRSQRLSVAVASIYITKSVPSRAHDAAPSNRRTFSG